MQIKQERAKQLGRECSGFFGAYINWIVSECKENGIEKIYFLTREGEFFKQILDHINKDKDSKLESALLYVSRRSTYLPSLRSFDESEWERLFNQYGDQPVSAFIRSIGTPYNETLSLLEKQGLLEKVSVKTQMRKFKEAMNRKSVYQYLEEKRSEARDSIRAYLKKMGLQNETGKAAVVDIGWRGTIQDNLCYLLPKKTLYGYYLGMIQTINEQPENAVKKGFINRLPFARTLLKSHTQLEMVCSSWKGSVVAYQRSSDGEVLPVTEDNEQDLYSFNQYARFFQEGVIDGVQGRENRNYMAPLLKMTLFPDKYMADAFFAFKYSERFGLGVDVDMSKIGLSLENLLAKQKTSREHCSLRACINRTMWPQGYFRIHGLSWLIPLYNAVLFCKER